MKRLVAAILLARPRSASCPLLAQPQPAQEEFVPVDARRPSSCRPRRWSCLRMRGVAPDLLVRLVALAAIDQGRARGGTNSVNAGRQKGDNRPMGGMTAAHFIFIPAVLLVGIVIGWILGPARRLMRTPRSSENRRNGGGPQAGETSDRRRRGRSSSSCCW